MDKTRRRPPHATFPIPRPQPLSLTTQSAATAPPRVSALSGSSQNVDPSGEEAFPKKAHNNYLRPSFQPNPIMYVRILVVRDDHQSCHTLPRWVEFSYSS